DAAIRQHTGASVVAIIRHNTVVPNPPSHYRLNAGDTLAVLGTVEQEQAFHTLIHNGADDVQQVAIDEEALRS
ncbi:MAG: hypothetical protein HC893_13885, partial [Chloroflexaceae bacterium]|nr:hypothetical protein [Chloroflexaceae bacterium]